MYRGRNRGSVQCVDFPKVTQLAREYQSWDLNPAFPPYVLTFPILLQIHKRKKHMLSRGEPRDYKIGKDRQTGHRRDPGTGCVYGGGR